MINKKINSKIVEGSSYGLSYYACIWLKLGKQRQL